jgi:phage repressor protein C with HTH and peptisase S24 domain
MNEDRRGRRGPSANEEHERESDRLIRWVGEQIELPDPADPANADFYDWWATELRAREGVGSDDAERLAGEFAARLATHVVAGEARIPSLGGRPSGERTSLDDATLRVSIAAAERSRAAVVVDHAVAAGGGRDLWDEPAERWVDLPDGVPDGRYVVLTVAGDSMLPALHSGDSVLVKVGTELTRHSIVVARRPDDGYVVKRVGTMTRRHVELVSLNPTFPPVRIPRDERLVVGTVVLRWCTH